MNGTVRKHGVAAGRPRIMLVNLGNTGLGRYGLLYAKAVAARDDVEVLSVAETSILEEPFLAPHVVDLSCVGVSGAGGVSQRVRLLGDLRRITREFRPDLIHDTQGSSPKSAVTWPLFRRWAPLAVTEHDPVPHSGMRIRRAERLTRRSRRLLVRHVFVHGPACKEAMVAEGADPETVTVIRHGSLDVFDRGAFREVERRAREVLLFGELRSDKGLDLMPRIAARVRERLEGVRFVVAGSINRVMRARYPEWAETATRVLDELRDTPGFEIHDRFIPDEEVERFFRRAAVTLMPYRDATQSGVAMVAMPLGSVIVATRVGDLPYVVRHGETGFLAEPETESIATTLVAALEDPDRLARVREAARSFAADECAWDRVAERAAHAYRTILGPTTP